MLRRRPVLYRLSFRSLLAYYAALGISLWLMATRNDTEPWASLPGFVNTWGQHTSNFALSFMLVTAIGLFWVLQGVPRKAYLWMAGVIAALNVVAELFVPVLNTRDVVDIPFGVAGVLAGLFCLYLIDRSKVPLKR